MSETIVYHGEALGQYGFGEGHPFGPDRMDVFVNRYRELGLDQCVVERGPYVATQAQIERFHTHDYVELVKERSVMGEGYLDGGDTPAYKGVYETASTVVGTVLHALEAIMNTEAKRAFVPIAGLHHARRDSASGFCVFNDCGIAIETLQGEYGLQHVAYVDIDAHHGDGVFYGFEDDPRVLFADIHEDGQFLYPGTGFIDETGTGDAKGMKLNLPAPPNSRDDVFDIYWDKVENYLHQYQPEFIILQAGADSIDGDPITHMRFSTHAHATATRRLCEIADQYCEGRLLVTGGGGYNRDNIAKTWTSVVQAMVDHGST